MKLASGHFVEVTHIVLWDPILLAVAIEKASNLAMATDVLSPEGNPLRLTQCPINFRVGADAIWFPVRDILQGHFPMFPPMEDLQIRTKLDFRAPALDSAYFSLIVFIAGQLQRDVNSSIGPRYEGNGGLC
jgi:hypothetical protein